MRLRLLTRKQRRKKFNDFKQEALQLAKEEKSIFDTRITEAQKEVVDMTGIIDSLTKELIELKEQAKNEQNNKVSKTLNTNEEESKKLKNNLEENKQLIKQLKKRQETLDATIEGHESKIEELVTENKDLAKKNAGYIKEILKLSKNVEEATKTMGEQNEMFKMMKKQDKESRDLWKAKDKEHENLRKAKEEHIEALKKQLEDVKKSMKKGKDANETDDGHLLKDIQGKLDIERNKSKKLQEKIDEMKVQNSKLETLLLETQKDWKVDKLALIKFRQNEGKTLDQNEIVEYEDTISIHLMSIEDLKTENSDLKNRLKEEMRKKIVAELEVKKLKDTIKESEEKAAQLNDSIKDESLEQAVEEKNEEEKENLFEQLLDETNATRKTKEQATNPRQELTSIINDSIKDDCLRDCLTSIIKKEDVKQEPEEEAEPETDPYDTLDRFPQLGLDDEIDPYLGEDKPGEFDNYLKNDEDESGDEFESSEEGVENDDNTSESLPDHPKEDLDIMKERVETWSQEPGEGGEGDCKRFEDMTNEELAAHWKLVNSMTAEEVFTTAPEPQQTTEQRLLALGGEDDDDNLGQDPEDSVKTESSVVGTTDSTDNDCSSLASDTTVPLSDIQEDECPPQLQVADTCPARPQVSQEEAAKVSVLEASVSRLQSMVMGLAAQVTTLTNKMDDSNFEAGLLAKTVEMLQQKNSKLTETVDSLETRNNLLESNLVEVSKHLSTNDVKDLKDSFLEILSSCENFQTSFDSMADRQEMLDAKLTSVNNSLVTAGAERLELQEDFNKLADKFSSLQLEYQVDKSQAKVQMDNLAYNLAMLSTNKMPTPESVSSTSGVKSDDVDYPDDLDKVGSLAFLDLKENVTPNTKETPKSKSKESKKASVVVSSSGASTLVPGPATVFPAGAVYGPSPRPGTTVMAPPRFPPHPLSFYPHVQGQTTPYSGQHIIYQPGTGALLPPHQIFYR